MGAGPHRNRLPRSTPPEDGLFSRQVGSSSDPDSSMSAANFFIPSLPGQPSNSTLVQYAGHIPSAPIKNGQPDTESDAHLFFYMIRNRHIADQERTLIWFNGGPGCSSFDGAMMEVGPLRLVPGGQSELQEVEGAWNEYANVIFIDQPVGTGYSYMATNSYVHELPEAAQHIVKFLENFYKVFPEFQNHQTFLGGESYAGQYIPYIASAILNSRLPTSQHLSGLLIGNGWIDPWNQYPAYLDFALQAGVIKPGSTAESKVKKEVERCKASIEKGGKKNMKIHNGVCEGILGSITDSTIQSVNGQNMCVNNYDVRLTDTHPACGMNWPPDLVELQPYLSRDDVKTSFHATRHPGPWKECNGQVGSQFYTPLSAPSVRLLPELLTRLKILMFAGAEDLICNHVGIEKMIDDLEWNGELGFGNETAVDDWYVNGKRAGTWTSARNMTYVKILDASHMVPYDQPLAAHDMFLRFIGVSDEFLNAAGPAATIPSRIGSEREAVLGSTLPNGTALGDALSDPERIEKLIAGEGGGVGSDGKSLTDGLNGSAIEGLVNASSAIVLILIMILAFGGFIFLRRKFGGRNKFNRGAGGGWGAVGGSSASATRGRHSRIDSLGRGGGMGLGGVTGDSTEEEEQELDELMKSRRRTELEEADEEERIEGKGKGKAKSRLGDESEIFGLGAEEEDDDDPEQRRRYR
ncbi:S10 family peptidase [Sporobolomyces salmoneus]|uniref:S10 family peptidase n=1 Tax=Sporobolomyces salmoneus TaxID=183962 RepID=UPI003170D0A5